MMTKRSMLEKFLRIFILALIISASTWPALAQDTTSTQENFPSIIPFFDLIALPKPAQEAYIEELRETLAGVAKSEEPGQVRLFVQGEDLPASFIRQILFTPAFAQSWNSQDPVGQKCDNGAGDQVLCVNNANGSSTECLCAHSRSSFINDYGANVILPQSSGCQMSSDASASQDIASQYASVWVGGSQMCVTRSSYQKVQNQIGSAELKGSLHDALTDAEKSKVFADKAKRLIRTDQLAADLAAHGTAKNPVNGVSLDHIYDRGTPSSEAQKKAAIALGASERVKDESHLVGAADPTAKLLAREQTNKSLDLMKAAVAGARKDGVNADLEAQRALLEAQKIDPSRPDARVIDAVGNGIEAAGASGAAGADLNKAAANLTDAQKAMNPAADDAAGNAIKKETTETSAAAAAVGKELLAKGQDVANMAAQTLKGPIDAAASDKQTKLRALQASLDDLKSSLGRGAKDDIVAKTAAANDKLKDVREKLNLPPPKDGAPSAAGAKAPSEPPVTCIKTGTFKCPNRKQKAGTQALDKARAALLAQDGEKACIFGGSASTFGASVEGRGTKSRKGCAPKFDFDLKIGDTNYKLTCPPAKKNERLVVCNPVLYGYENGPDGTPAQAHCVDWTSMVTADCNYKFPLRHGPKKTVGKTATSSVSPVDLLNNEKAQLEPSWENLSRAISRHCNSENFRSLNCSECEQISTRLGQMKVKATAGTCTWPSELGTIRSSMKGTVK